MIRYMSENLDHPERRQPHAYDVWQSVRKQLRPGEKITVLNSGPLTNLANISLSDMDASSVIEVCAFCPLLLVVLVTGDFRCEFDINCIK